MNNTVNRDRKGFTLIELLLVVAIITLLAASSGPSVARLLMSNNLEVSVNKIVSVIRKSQNYAMNSKDSSVWGVCMVSQNIRLYQGSCASPSYFENYETAGVNISGLTDTSFLGEAGLRGEPSNPLTITVSNDISSSVINLNMVGAVNIN